MASGATELPDRDALTVRAVPSMILSDGSASSLTAPPSNKTAIDPNIGAKERFSVRGNFIVTGGTGTLGLASCNALLEHGLEGLTILDVNPAQAKNEVASLQARFPHVKIKTLKVDVTDEKAVQDAVEETVATLGSADGLVCFVGVVGCVETLEMPASQWRKIIDINTTGSFICAQAVARQMVKQGTGGSITFTSSISAHRVNYPNPKRLIMSAKPPY
ncbi:Oxidoreductase short chain dehydrogenase reductase family [Fusarium circinatum]|uniref:Oxidoreductase short chain dehydrogenase reductase family n=1 Tax=Fusarium circinatum TaxID=48490 RepID=A0A8H5TND4_FUSCI|nr:Oxidoreductase short chain dehydrogenase reductase family [Fusarium circinatum]